MVRRFSKIICTSLPCEKNNVLSCRTVFLDTIPHNDCVQLYMMLSRGSEVQSAKTIAVRFNVLVCLWRLGICHPSSKGHHVCLECF